MIPSIALANKFQDFCKMPIFSVFGEGVTGRYYLSKETASMYLFMMSERIRTWLSERMLIFSKKAAELLA